jgi:hypothetical protein
MVKFLNTFEKEQVMKKISMLSLVLLILLGAVLASGCGVKPVESAQALAAEEATATTAPLPTDTAAVEILPAPTDTLPASSPTPSRIEFPVQNDSMTAQIMGVETPFRVYLGKDAVQGTDLFFSPGEGNFFLGLGIKVSNLTGADIPLKWSDVYITNKFQDRWYPVWGTYEDTNSTIDPLGVEILAFDQVNPDFDPDAHFYVGDNGYVRVIFQLPKDNLHYFFGISDLPMIEINWKYY